MERSVSERMYGTVDDRISAERSSLNEIAIVARQSLTLLQTRMASILARIREVGLRAADRDDLQAKYDYLDGQAADLNNFLARFLRTSTLPGGGNGESEGGAGVPVGGGGGEAGAGAGGGGTGAAGGGAAASAFPPPPPPPPSAAAAVEAGQEVLYTKRDTIRTWRAVVRGPPLHDGRVEIDVTRTVDCSNPQLSDSDLNRFVTKARLEAMKVGDQVLYLERLWTISRLGAIVAVAGDGGAPARDDRELTLSIVIVAHADEIRACAGSS